MVELKQTRDGIYYLHDYIRKHDQQFYDQRRVEISQDIWKYKDGGTEEMLGFTKQLLEAIAIISRGIDTPNIGLVAVPSSKTNKKSTICESISTICWWQEKYDGAKKFGCNKRIYDFSKILIRTRDVQSAHLAKERPTYEEHYASIECTRRMPIYGVHYIILDDVTTTGTIMDVCRDKLLAKNIPVKDISRLAIAKTL